MNLTEGVPKVGALELLQGSLVMQMPDHLHILAAAAGETTWRREYERPAIQRMREHGQEGHGRISNNVILKLIVSRYSLPGTTINSDER